MAGNPTTLGADAKEQSKARTAKGLRSLSSLRTALVLLLLLIVMSMGGALLCPDIFSSIGFRLVTGLLGLNIVLTSWKRWLVLTRSTFGRPPIPLSELESWPVYSVQTAESNAKELTQAAKTLLKRRGFRLQTHEDRDRLGLYAVKGLFTSWGTMTAHLSLLLIIGGAVSSQYFGFRTEVQLPVGDVFALSPAQFSRLQAPVFLRLNQFVTEYDEHGAVSNWLSDVSLERDGQIVLRQELRVNGPLTFEGLVVYQLSYGSLVQTQILDAAGNITSETRLKERELLPFTGPEWRVELLRVLPHGPIAYVVYRQNQPAAWGTADPGEVVPLANRQQYIRFGEIVPFAVLLIKHDPGVPWVFCGFVLLTIGLIFSLYVPRIDLWLTIVPYGANVLIRIHYRDERSASRVADILEPLPTMPTDMRERSR